MWARCIEGVRKVAAQCFITVGSHSWLRTGAARVPIFWSSHAVSRRRAGPHSFNGPSRPRGGAPSLVCPTEETRCVQHRVSVGQDSHRRDVVHTLRRDVSLLDIIDPVKGEPSSRLVVHSPLCLIAVPLRYGGPILATSRPTPFGRANTGPGRVPGEGRRKGAGGAMSGPPQAALVSPHPHGR